MKHLLRLCALALATAFALGATPFDAQAAKILHRGNPSEPYSLDPHRAVSAAENNIIGDMLIGLYTEDAKGVAILGAAESAETSALTAGAVWHTMNDSLMRSAVSASFSSLSTWSLATRWFLAVFTAIR